jgi:hypothetical protein
VTEVLTLLGTAPIFLLCALLGSLWGFSYPLRSQHTATWYHSLRRCVSRSCDS